MVKVVEELAVATTMKEAVNETLANIEKLETHLPQFLSSLSDTEISPLQRSHSLFSLLKLTNILFSLKLRCRGINPRSHPIKSEFERLSLYQRKLERLMDLSEAQKQDMRNISGSEGPSVNYQEQAGQKRKYSSSEETAAEEFQEKTTGAFLRGSNGSIQEPILIDLSSDDDNDDEHLAA